MSLQAPSEALKLELLSHNENLPMALMESHFHIEGKSTKGAVFYNRGWDDIEMKETAIECMGQSCSLLY